MKVSILLKESSQAIEREAINTYTKGPFYVVYISTEKVEKYPLDIIWRVTESY